MNKNDKTNKPRKPHKKQIDEFIDVPPIVPPPSVKELTLDDIYGDLPDEALMDPIASDKPQITEMLINYNLMYKDAPPIMFRDDIIDLAMSCLIGKYKPNLLLTGVPGSGKTCIVADIARRLAQDDKTGCIPEKLKGYTIYELPLSSVVSGSALVGMIEEKMKDVLDFFSNPENKAIMFIDEIHMLADSNDKMYDKIAQIMKPALAGGKMKVIGATTIQESQALMDDPAINRRFSRISVDELTPEQTCVILEKVIHKPLLKHYDRSVSASKDLFEGIVSLADEFHTAGSHRPDNAITLLDRAMAEAYISLISGHSTKKRIKLTSDMVRKTALKLSCGLTSRPETNPERLRTALDVIKGQDNVIDKIIDILVRNSLGLYQQTKPVVMLFAGNSGVGKTEIAKILAREIMNTKPITLNMTEYNSDASINRIIGAPAGYVGSDSKAELPFDILETNPYQIILLDEFEKCDRTVQRLFMSVFDEGILTTSKGRTIDFSKAIIIASTNAGHSTKSASVGFGNNASSAASISDLSSFFDSELLNRFTLILNFNPISETVFRNIIIDKYARQIKSIKTYNKTPAAASLADTLSESEVKRLSDQNYCREFGARHVSDFVRKYIEDNVISARRLE